MRWAAAAIAMAMLARSPVAFANPALDELVAEVRANGTAEITAELERQGTFLEARDRQEAMVRQLREEVGRLDARADELRATHEANEELLLDLDDRIVDQAGELNDLFSLLRQNAAETSSLFERSMISAQFPDRTAPMQDLVREDMPVSMDSLESLWLALIQEMHQTGKVTRFPAPVITPEGAESMRTVTRVGVFTAFSDGRFLRYLPESGKLVELARQPSFSDRQRASELEQAQSGWMPVPVDPSKGAVLSLLVQSPGIAEQIHQSGVIGYLILIIGAIGLLIVLWRGVHLLGCRLAVRRELDHDRLADGGGEHRSSASTWADNPVARLRLKFREMLAGSDEIPHAWVDDAVGGEASRLYLGLTALAVFAAVTPLMGLLGTVIGMIETFQSISIFGTGDPRLMAGGISYALVTTQLGLAVAIPMLLFQSLLHGQAGRIVEILDAEGARLHKQFAKVSGPGAG